jgi:hypothetical protein
LDSWASGLNEAKKMIIDHARSILLILHSQIHHMSPASSDLYTVTKVEINKKAKTRDIQLRKTYYLIFECSLVMDQLYMNFS